MLIEFARLFDYAQPNDTAIAIVGPAFLDSLLKDILIEFMIDDEAEVSKLLESPLGNYGSRVSACYCLGLIGTIVKADLKLVSKIRNFFAHDIRATFSNQEVGQWCKALRWHYKLMGEPPPGTTNRDLFQVGVNQFVCYLGGVPGIARSRKRAKVLDA